MSRRVVASILLASLVPMITTSGATAIVGAKQARAGDATIGVRVIGHSVRGRPIRAYHLGEPGTRKVVLISTMHGDEPAPRQILDSLRNGAPIHGINLWVVPTYNPDGLARHTRKNARGIDLNRNYPYRWANLDGVYESGRSHTRGR